MAINISTNPTFTGRFTAVSAGYPYGSSKNETSPGAGDGTPYEIARANDILGFQQALLKSRAIVPSGNSDEVRDSQYLQAVVEYGAGAASFYTDSGAADAYVFDVVNADSQSPEKYFDGMDVVCDVANPNTGACTGNVAGLGVKSIKTLAGADPVAGEVAGRMTFQYDAANGWLVIIPNTKSVVSQAEAEAGTSQVPRDWTAERVAQAIAALGIPGTTLLTKQGTTSGTQFDFSIPLGVKEVTLHLIDVSVSSVSGSSAWPIAVRVGAAGTPQTAGYRGAYSEFTASAVATHNASAYLAFQSVSEAAAVYSGAITLRLEDAGANRWTWVGNVGASNGTFLHTTCGFINLSGEMDILRLYVAGGVGVFDAGEANVSYRF